MHTIVTGGPGFIGSHLTERLLRDGHTVSVIDNLSTGRSENLQNLAGAPGLDVHCLDIVDADVIEPLFKDADWVFHLAALGDIVPSIERPRDYFRANVDGTFNVLEASRRNVVKRFVYAASSSCYGIPDVYPTPETAPFRPQYPYALTKKLGEDLVLHWGQVYDLSVVSLRLFNAYGPQSRTSGTYGAVFGVFLAQKLAGKPFTIVGDGNQTRDFTFVSDVVEAFVAAARSELRDEAFNVGSDGTYSINRLVQLLDADATIVHIPKRPGEPDCTHADITKIRKAVGWRPKVSFEDGVSVVLDNIEYWRSAPVWTPETIADATRGWFRHLG